MTENLPLFNFAALPLDPVFGAKLTELAQNKYRLTARGYLLGPNALPHMTLCFFRTKSEEAACQIVLGIPRLPDNSMTVTIDMVYDRAHSDIQGSFFSTGLLVHKTRQLQDYQAEVHAHIVKAGGLEVSPISDAYWPHFTCAYTSVISTIQTTEILPWAIGEIPVRLGLGISDNIGQLLKEIKLDW